MIKARTWLALLVLSVTTVAATAGCGGDAATGSGASGDPGEGSIITAGGAGTSGAVGHAGAGNTGGDSGSGSTTPASGTLGATCVVDSDCGAGLTCLTSDSTTLGGLGGPSLGLCTVTCALDSDCAPFEAGAGCVNYGTTNDPQAFCFEGCVQGSDGTVTQCQGRPDIACADLSDPTLTTVPNPFCVPQCRSDLECGTGLFCNPQTGLCNKTKPTGDPVGTACDPAAATNNCLGTCIGVRDSQNNLTTGFCADLCSGYAACDFGAGLNATGFCMGQLSSNFGLGDLGYCEPLCDCSGDCKISGDKCQAWQNSAAGAADKTDLKSDGFCFPNVTGSVELTCGAAGAAGAGN